MLRKSEIRKTYSFLLANLAAIEENLQNPVEMKMTESKREAPLSVPQKIKAMLTAWVMPDDGFEQTMKKTNAELVGDFLRSKSKTPNILAPEVMPTLYKPTQIFQLLKHIAYSADEKIKPANPRYFLLSFLAYLHDLGRQVDEKTRQQFILNASLQLCRFASPLIDFYGSWDLAFSALAQSNMPVGEVIHIAKLGCFLEKLLMLPPEQPLALQLAKAVRNKDISRDSDVIMALSSKDSVGEAIKKRVSNAADLYQGLIDVLSFIVISRNHPLANSFDNKQLIESVATALHQCAGNKVERYGHWEGLLVCDIAKTDRQYHLRSLALLGAYIYLFAKLKAQKDLSQDSSLLKMGVYLLGLGAMTWRLVDPLAKPWKPILKEPQLTKAGFFGRSEPLPNSSKPSFGLGMSFTLL